MDHMPRICPAGQDPWCVAWEGLKETGSVSLWFDSVLGKFGASLQRFGYEKIVVGGMHSELAALAELAARSRGQS